MLSLRKIAPVAALVLGALLLQGAALNRPAPTFEELSDYKGKIVFINFWASWCGPCQVELPELNRLAAHYAGQNVHVLAINVDRHHSPANKLLAKLGLQHPHFRVVWDARSKVVSAYNIETMPSSFILDRHGMIQFIHVGFHPQDPEAWRKELEGLLRRDR